VKRKIAVVTTSRADYSHLYWPLRDLSSHPDIHLQLIVLGPHLSPDFGLTVRQIEADGFSIASRIECLLSSDTDVGMAKTIGVATLGLADCLGQMRPDLLVVTADRYEMLAPASVAVALRIPIVHIEGGEISEGAIDDAIRNALTKLSHIHFTSTQTARDRVIAMGEEPWRVHAAGSPSLDHLRRSTLLTREQLENHLDLRLSSPFALVGYHPATLARDTTREAQSLFDALENMPLNIVFCYPNADAGSRHLLQLAKAFRQSHPDAKIYQNLDPVSYWSLLKNARVLIGNSSSGIMEAASFAVPVVNVGSRQKGREHGANVLDADAQTGDILEKISMALNDDFSQSLSGMTNPYGDGKAAARIVEVIASVPLDETLLVKKAQAL
jgi:UDP-N-acetylglucosamine 2-epimerase (non-hydrolysing)/GDP/UDP-N,N'-diacetylbacillosamine 2-epimerase (hydrolysing)